MMKAVVLDAFGGVENLHWRDWMMPEPDEGEIRIKIKGISINPVDCKINGCNSRNGRYRPAASAACLLSRSGKTRGADDRRWS